MSLFDQHFVLPGSLSRETVIARIARVLSALPLSQAWSVEVKEHKATRSGQQNRYLWGVCYAVICQHLEGWNKDDVHEYMLGEHFGWETVSGFGRKRLRPIRRSRKLNKQEFADYIAFVQRRAAEHGIFIPDADGEIFPERRVA